MMKIDSTGKPVASRPVGGKSRVGARTSVASSNAPSDSVDINPLASQMAAAVYDSVGVEVTSAGYVFKASRTEVKFPGFLAVYEEGRDEDGGELQTRLPNLQEGAKNKLVTIPAIET